MRRSPLLVSAILHLLVMSVLLSLPVLSPSVNPPAPEPEALEVRERVFLPPVATLRNLGAPQPVVPLAPKDRMSIGAPSRLRAKELRLNREDDLTAAPKGRREASGPLATPAPSDLAPAEAPPQATRDAGPSEGVPFLPGAGRVTPRGEQPAEHAIAGSLATLDRRLAGGGGAPGIEAGVGRQMGPLFFDPQGADFTAWVNHFKNEVYRNWVVPQSALFGFAKGKVACEFTVDRDGRVSAVRLIESSATGALDRAALNALRSSRLLPLPGDFGPQRLTIQVTFYYGEQLGDA